MAQITVAEELVKTGRTGMSLVTTVPAKLIDAGVKVTVGSRLKADIDNTSDIFIGWANTITAGTDINSGYKMSPGDEIPLPAEEMQLIFARSLTGTQKLYWFVY